MRIRLWWPLLLVTAVLLATAPPSSAHTSLPSPASRPAAGCKAPQDVRQQNLQKADYALDASGAGLATSWVAGKAAAQQAAVAAAKREATALAAAELAEGSAALYGTLELLTGWGGVILFGGYLYYKYVKDDPLDSHFTMIATPRILSAAVDVRGMTPAEAAAVNALAANTQQLLAVTRALATTQNRTSGAVAAGQADWAARQADTAKQYAQQLAGLLDAQPALRARLEQALAADPRYPAVLQPGASEVRAFQSDLAAHGLPSTLAQIAQQAGFDARDRADLQSSIGSADRAAVAGFAYPGALTDSQITAFDTSQAASWRQFAAGTCQSTLPPNTVTFKLVPGLTEVHKFHGNLTMDAEAKTAHVDQGIVTWDENWTIPDTLTPGKQASVTLGLDVTNTGQTPCTGCYTVGFKVTAPGLNEQLLLDISKQLKGEKTYTWTIPEGLKSADDLTIQIQTYESSSIIYHYRK